MERRYNIFRDQFFLGRSQFDIYKDQFCWEGVRKEEGVETQLKLKPINLICL